ncbi:putative alpha/beta hydrolase [Cladochytrium replicatum]|nr:putative alpha/beta hydrolase [Cladochytrium replicatum]
MASPASAFFFRSTVDPSKPTLIFLHAAWMSADMFDETISHIAPQLGDKFNLVQIDMNGHGKTVEGRKEFDLWDQARDLISFMDLHSISQAILVGISMGALIALRAALTAPLRITALVVMAATGAASSEQDTANFRIVRNIWVSTPTPPEPIMDASIVAWGGDPDVNGVRSRRIKDAWIARHSGAENVDAVLKSVVGRDDVLERLGSLEMPVLIVHGEHDATWPLEHAENIQAALKKAKSVRLEVVKESGHLVVAMRDSEDVSELIVGFAKEVVEADRSGL